MKSLIAASAALLLISGPVLAGGLGEPVMDPEPIVEDTSSSASQDILVPLLTLILLAAAVNGN